MTLADDYHNNKRRERNPRSKGRARHADQQPNPGASQQLCVTCAADIEVKPLEFLVPNLIPRGKLVLVAGEGGLGKSTLTLDLAARLSRGEPAFGLEYEPMTGSTLLASCEDDREDTVVPRLRACGAKLEQIHFLDGVETATGQRPAAWSLAHHEALENYLHEHRDVRLVVIDPAAAFAGRAGVDGHKDAELRALLGPLSDLAAAHHVTVLMVAHTGKADGRRAVHRVLGSVGWINAVRAAVLVSDDPDDAGRKLVLPLKANLSPSRTGFAYRLDGLSRDEQDLALDGCTHLSQEDRDRLAAQLYRPVYLGPVEVDPDDVMAAHARRARDDSTTRTKQAAEWIKQGLNGYAWPDSEIEDAGLKAGFTEDNIRRGKKHLREQGLISCPLTSGGPWWVGFGKRKEWQLRPASLMGQFGAPSQHSEDSRNSKDSRDWSPGQGQCGESRESGESRQCRDQIPETWFAADADPEVGLTPFETDGQAGGV
jgi:hypothetical protein